MDKRTFQALLVCFAISILYLNWIVPPPENQEASNPVVSNPVVSETTVGGQATGDSSTIPILSPGSVDSLPNTTAQAVTEVSALKAGSNTFPVRSVSLSNADLELKFSSQGAILTEALLMGYHESVDDELPLPVISPKLKSQGALGLRVSSLNLDLTQRNWEVLEQTDDSVSFRTQISADQFVIHHCSIHPKEGFEISSRVSFGGAWPAGTELYYEILGAERIRFDASGRAASYPNQWVHAQRNKDGSIMEAVHSGVEALESGEVTKTKVAWGGLESNYFAQVIRVEDGLEFPTANLIVKGVEPGVNESLYDQYSDEGIQGWPMRVGFRRMIDPRSEHEYAFFVGPKDPEVLEADANQSWDAIQLIDYGFFGWLCRPFLWLLRISESVLGSWGLAIIFLTFCIRAVLHPVNKRNQRQMQVQQQGMARIKPQMDEIRERYKSDPTTQHRKTQELFKQEGVNPAAMFGGCLFIFMQLPIWIALINTFSVAIELRQTGFLWIDDLTQPDMLFQMPFALPLLGQWFNLLPLVYVVVTLVNQRMMPKSDDPQVQAQQKMMTFMMMAFGFIFYSFASGLLIYFIISALVGIVEQKMIRKELAAAGIGPGAAPVAASQGASSPGPAGPGKGPGRPGRGKNRS